MRKTGSNFSRALSRAVGIITAVGLMFLGLIAPSASAAELTVCAGGACNYESIQDAIGAAQPGDTIAVGAGTYTGSLVLSKRITIRGAGATQTFISGGGSGTAILIDPATSGTARASLEDVAVTGFTGTGVALYADHLTLDGVIVTGSGIGASIYAVALPGLTTRSDIAIVDSTLGSTTVGLKIPSTTAVDGLIIDGTAIEGTRYGIYADAPSLADLGDGFAAPITDVAITDSTFTENTEKGIYMERLSAALFSGLTFTDNGTLAMSSSRGLNLNLKYGTYSDITISDSTFVGNGTGTMYGAAITVAARNDGATYSQKPATLADLTISGVTVSGSHVGISLENDVDLATTTVQNTRLIGYTVAGLLTSGTDAGTLVSATDAFDRMATGYDVVALSGSVDATGSAWGDAGGADPARLAGTVLTSPWIHEYTDDPAKAGEPGFWPTEITYASTPVTVVQGEDPAPASFEDPSSGASISIDLPTPDAGGTLEVESLTKPGADVADAVFSAGSVFFDIAFDGTITDPATICITYPSGDPWPEGTRLYHYEDGAWVDVTSSLVGGLLCGTVTSFSPFAGGILTVGTEPSVTAVTATPDEQVYGGDVAVTAEVTDLEGNETIVSVEYTIDGGTTWLPMSFTSGTTYAATITKPDVGSYTVYVRATDAASNVTDPITADNAKDTFEITTADAFVAFTGNSYNTSTTVKLEATVSGQCKAGIEVSFAIDLDGNGDYTGAGEQVGTSTTNLAGVATLSYTGLATGAVKDVLVSVEETTNCTAAEGTAVIIVAATGDASNGGGSYTSGGRMNFGYSLQVKSDKRTMVKTVSGQFLWQKQGSVRIKGIITGYSTGTSADYCPTGYTGTGTCALVTGSASVYEWNEGLATWDRIATNVAFRVKVFDGGTSVSCLKKNCTTTLKPDWIQVWVPSDPLIDGTSSTLGFQIKGGNISAK